MAKSQISALTSNSQTKIKFCSYKLAVKIMLEKKLHWTFDMMIYGCVWSNIEDAIKIIGKVFKKRYCELYFYQFFCPSKTLNPCQVVQNTCKSLIFHNKVIK